MPEQVLQSSDRFSLLRIIASFLPLKKSVQYESFFRKVFIKYGAHLIYEGDSILTFKEIAERWQKIAQPKDGFSYEENIERFLSAIWLGEFEDKEKTEYRLFSLEAKEWSLDDFQPVRPIKMPVSRELLLNPVLLISCRPVFDKVVSNASVDWLKLSQYRLSDYDRRDNTGSGDMFRGEIERILLRKEDFIFWLTKKSRNRRIPTNWKN